MTEVPRRWEAPVREHHSDLAFSIAPGGFSIDLCEPLIGEAELPVPLSSGGVKQRGGGVLYGSRTGEGVGVPESLEADRAGAIGGVPGPSRWTDK